MEAPARLSIENYLGDAVKYSGERTCKELELHANCLSPGHKAHWDIR